VAMNYDQGTKLFEARRTDALYGCEIVHGLERTVLLPVLDDPLRKGRSDFIALAIPEMASPYFAELGAAISRAAKRRGITVLIDQTEGEAAAEKVVLDGMRGQLIDGIIFSPITTVPAKLTVAYTGKPLVLLGERPAGGQFDRVAVNSVQASCDATTHLISIGRRRTRSARNGVRPVSALRVGWFRRRQDIRALSQSPVVVRRVPAHPRLHNRPPAVVTLRTLREARRAESHAHRSARTP